MYGKLSDDLTFSENKLSPRTEKFYKPTSQRFLKWTYFNIWNKPFCMKIQENKQMFAFKQNTNPNAHTNTNWVGEI